MSRVIQHCHNCKYKKDCIQKIGFMDELGQIDSRFELEYCSKFSLDKTISFQSKFNKYVELKNDLEYLTDFIHKNKIDGEMKLVEIDDKAGFFKMKMDESNSPKSIEELKFVDWNLIDKYFENREDVLDCNNVVLKQIEIENKIEMEKQKHLHLCIAVRPYLWT